jgi:hypothetical protein
MSIDRLPTPEARSPARFAKSPPVAAPVVKNLRMADNLNDPGTDTAPATAGHQTQVPILRWDPVPGASSYQVDVAPAGPTLADCNWTAIGSSWTVNTSVNAWTPLGIGWNGQKPYPDAMSVASDVASLVAVLTTVATASQALHGVCEFGLATIYGRWQARHAPWCKGGGFEGPRHAHGIAVGAGIDRSVGQHVGVFLDVADSGRVKEV